MDMTRFGDNGCHTLEEPLIMIKTGDLSAGANLDVLFHEWLLYQ
jgi:hypothetical protein